MPIQRVKSNPNEGQPKAPENLDAERLCLGACIYGTRDSLDQVLRDLDPHDFSSAAHRIIFSRIKKLIEMDYNLDRIILREHLLANGELQDSGGVAYLEDLEAPNLDNLNDYIRIVKEKSNLRRLIYIASSVMKEAESQRVESIDIVKKFEESLYEQFKVSQVYRTRSFEEYISSLSNEELLSPSATQGYGIATGYRQLDELTGGIFPGQIFTIAAGSGRGKSIIVNQILKHAAMNGVPSILFTPEMDEKAIFNRLACQEAGITMRRFLSGDIHEGEMKRLMDAKEFIRSLPIHIDSDPDVTVSTIDRKVKRAQEKYGIKIAGLDYLQLLQPVSSRMNDLEAMQFNCRALMSIAKRTVPFIVLSQFSKLVWREKREPRVDDIFGSSHIEFMSHVIVLVHRSADLKQEGYGDEYRSVFNVAKHRDGKQWKCEMEFLGWQYRYLDNPNAPPIPED